MSQKALEPFCHVRRRKREWCFSLSVNTPIDGNKQNMNKIKSRKIGEAKEQKKILALSLF
jgi:hypothetical protein